MIKTQLKLQAKRNLALFIQSKSTGKVPVSTRGMVEAYYKSDHEKCGEWPTAKLVPYIDQYSCTALRGS